MRRVVIVTAVLLGFSAVATASTNVVLRGVDSQNLAPFTLAKDSNVLWSCPSCSGDNFIMETAEEPGVINALGPTRGLSFLPHGHYTGVSVVGSGNWTITITPARPRPVKSSYMLTGVDSTNLRPFTLTHASKVVWSCPACASSNFIFETSESPGIVNALNHTHGNSYIPKGHYTGVSVDGAGAWSIRIT